MGEVRADEGKLEQMMGGDAVEGPRLGEVEKLVTQKLDELKQTITLMKAGDYAGAMKIVKSDEGRSCMDEIRADVSAMEQTEEDLLKQRTEAAQLAYQTTLWSIVTPAVLGVVLVGAVFLMNRRNERQQEESARLVAGQKELLRVTLASVGDAVIATDTEARVNYLNPTAERLTGWTNGEAQGKPLHEVFNIVNEETRKEVESPVAKSLREGAIVGLANHTVLIGKDGKAHPIDDSAAPIRDVEGNVLGVVMVFHDISERKKLEKERDGLLNNEQAMRVEAETANRAKDLFLATLSHELRTPLNAIVGWMSILRREGATDRDFREGMKVIERNTRAQIQLIEDVLDVSRIVSGKLRLDIKPCDLADAINSGVDAVRAAAEARNITLELDLDPAAKNVPCDGGRIQQVVWNLVSNAVKFTPKGGKVTVRLTRERSGSRIEVSDSGMGIGTELLPYVFDRFRQADSSTRRKYGGLGLGLSIVKHIVEMHGGTVEAFSDGDGKGAKFVVMLPIRAVVVGETVPLLADGDGEEEGEAVGVVVVRLDGLRVLVVDDEADARRLLGKVLGDAGAEVTAVGSAAEAMAVLAGERQHVIVSDLGMPDVDGLDLMENIRKAGFSEKDLPAVALTAFVHADDVNKVRMAGFQVHVRKPVDPHDLTAVIARVVRGES